VSFLAVYRELFEIVLFYQALWAQTEGASREAVFAGIAVALVALGAIGFAVFRYSVRLPIGPFFSVTSLILAALAVVFTGQGIAALQEAGVVTMTRVGWNGLPALGVHGTVEGLAAQALALLLVVCLLAAARRGRASQPMQASG
jgi:high-affinity iron transporter